MWSAEKIGAYLAGIIAAIIAYHKGYMAALQKVKTNNAKKQAQYEANKKDAAGVTLGDVADKLQNGDDSF
jgi:hypothetical protein